MQTLPLVYFTVNHGYTTILVAIVAAVMYGIVRHGLGDFLKQQ